MRFIRLPIAIAICAIALALPYKVRVRYMLFLAALAHLPFRLFGFLARRLLAALGEKNPYMPVPEPAPTPPAPQTATAGSAHTPPPGAPHKLGKCAVLFSGGTDSTCTAALLAERFDEIHLLTFYEFGTRNSPVPSQNVDLLRKRFPGKRFIHRTFSTDTLVKRIAYHKYLSTILRHGFFALATPGFSTLSWHLATISYCRREGISSAADGQTRELLHFPGHMDAVIALFRGLYAEFGVQYENPVRGWAVPPDQQVLDRLIVDRHGFFVSPSGKAQEHGKTTGDYLFALGIFPHRNVKGSALDRSMQHDCYPFVLYNVFAFWLYLPFHDQKRFEQRMAALFHERIADCAPWIMAGEVEKLVEERP